MKTRWQALFGGPPEIELLQAAYRFALSLSRNPHDAEDLVQEASLKLCRRYGRIKNQALLFTTVRRLYYDQYRRSQVIEFQSLDSGMEEMEPGTWPDELTMLDLESALDELQADERELIYLNKVAGYTAQEISEVIEQPRGTVLWRLSQAMKKLRNFCAGNEQDTPTG